VALFYHDPTKTQQGERVMKQITPKKLKKIAEELSKEGGPILSFTFSNDLISTTFDFNEKTTKNKKIFDVCATVFCDKINNLLGK
jgi:hypothetical protein